MMTTQIGTSGGPLCSAPSHASSKFQLCAQKCDHLPPPPNPYISETAFSHRFQKVYTAPPPPPKNESLAQQTKSSENPQKSQNPLRWCVLNVTERYAGPHWV